VWTSTARSKAPVRARTEGRVASVIDGDTVVLDSGEKVRYLGVDAPETAHDGTPADCFGNEAARANSALVRGEKVFLRYSGRWLDPHGRLLAYVYLKDGRCASLELVRSGHALVYRTRDEDPMLPELLALQREAIARGLGMWSACPVKPEPRYIANRRSFVFHRLACPFGRVTSRRSLVQFEDRWSALREGYRPCRECKP
jgi:micrococcal nuclease